MLSKFTYKLPSYDTIIKKISQKPINIYFELPIFVILNIEVIYN